jgi:hypothetical protein
MNDPISPRQRLARAIRARVILEDPLVREVFGALEQRLHDSFANSAPNDTGVREAAYSSLRALQDFKAEFECMLSDGKVAERDLEEMRRSPS